MSIPSFKTTVRKIISSIDNTTEVNNDVLAATSQAEAFVTILKWLPELNIVLKKLKSSVVAKEPEAEKLRKICNNIEECRKYADRLEMILAEVSHPSGKPWKERYNEAARGDELVEEVMKSIIMTLLRAVGDAHGSDIPTEKLKEALQELGRLEPSRVRNFGGTNITNSGSGNQANALGGEQNNNFGDGTQNFGSGNVSNSYVRDKGEKRDKGTKK